ncbi:MAG: hypothetical protein ACK5LR_10775 [Mangrovibacterium sp.]
MKNYFSAIFFLISLLCSCNISEIKGTPIAEVNGKPLFQEDLAREYPHGLSLEDSTAWAKEYIHSWIKSELLLQEAERTLSASSLDVERELDKYRKQLLIYRFENTLQSYIDTAISASDLKNYFPNYQTPKSSNEQLVKGVYMKFPWSQVDINTISNLFKNRNFNDLTNYGRNLASEMADYSNKWVELPHLLAYLPADLEVDLKYFSKKNYIDGSDTDFYYFLCIYNFDSAANRQALSILDEEDMRNTIIYKRKQEYLNNLKNQMFEEAEASQNIIIY